MRQFLKAMDCYCHYLEKIHFGVGNFLKDIGIGIGGGQRSTIPNFVTFMLFPKFLKGIFDWLTLETNNVHTNLSKILH